MNLQFTQLPFSLLLVCFFTLIGCSHDSAPRNSSGSDTGNSSLVVDADSLNIGHQWASSVFRSKILVTNPGPEYMVIEDVRGACSCTKTPHDPIVLRPKQSYEIPIQLDLNTLSARGYSPETPFSTGIEIHVSKRPPARFNITGVIKRPIVVERSNVRFGVIQSSLASHREIHVLTPTEVPVLRVVAADDSILRVEVDGPRLIDSDRTEFVIKIAPRPSLPVGPFESVVLVSTDSGKTNSTIGRNPASSIAIAVTGTVAYRYVLEPAMLDLGLCITDSVIQQRVRIRPLDGSRIDFRSIASSMRGLDVSANVNSDRNVLELLLRIIPKFPGAQKGAFTVTCIAIQGDKQEAIETVLPVRATILLK